MTTLETINLLQRITGLTAFALLFVQIVIGSNMDYLKSKFGEKVQTLHIANGLLTYLFIFMHPALMVATLYFGYSKIDPFYVYVDYCLLCDGRYEYIINFGRLAFLSVTIAVFAGLFRGTNLWMRRNWKKMHILNYFAFYFVSIHSYYIGTDSTTKLFTFFFWMFQFVVLITILKKLSSLNLKLPKIS